MKITNKYGLPDTIVNAVKRPTYSKGGANLSATEILTSPRIVQLRKKHQAEIEQDVSDMVWSLFGTAIHGVLEHGKDDSHVVEERLHTTLDGWSISGAIDLQTVINGTVKVSDYKTTGAWGVMNEKMDWTYQLNIYAWLVERAKGLKVTDLEIIAIIRDWSKREAERREDYPKAPIVALPISLWGMEKTEAFVKEKLHQHADAYMSAEIGDDLPLCSSEDMWEKPAVWAVKKPKNVRAKSLHDSKESAEKAVETLGNEYTIEFRPGERVRCENYCSVSEFCNQWADYRRE